MGKLIFWLALAVLIWWLVKRPPRDSADSAKPSGKSPAGAADPAESERVVRCDACGVFIPESESRSLDGKISCHDPQRCAHPVPS